MTVITEENRVATDQARLPFKVAELTLAESGRREIRLAEHEMPGLMAVRAPATASSQAAGGCEGDG